MIPTEKIALNGHEYPFHFGTGAVYLLGLELGLEDIKLKELDHVMEEMELSKMPLVLWVGFVSGASKAGRDPEKVISVDEIAKALKKNPYALDRAMDIVNGLKEEYSEDIEGKPGKAKK